MSWRFSAMRRGEMNIDPIEHEFFATETLDSPTDALVREAIQNSLDAAVKGGKVRVRFRIAEASADTRKAFIDGLWPHVDAAFDSSAEPPRPGDPLRYLLVEDTGTRGLEGDPRQYEDDSGDRGRNDYYYFWRNIGRSRKETTDRGRWGLGKTVFAAASRLNAFFGATLRRSDRQTLLMGQAVLKIHRVGKSRYRPYGYFGTHDDEDLAMPIEEPAVVRDFERGFDLRRSGPGLSIVVPFPHDEIDATGLLVSVLKHYFHPLLAEKLEVELEEEGSPKVILSGADLEREMRDRESLRSMLPIVGLARWGASPEPEALAALAAPPAGKALKLTEDLFDPTVLSTLRQQFDEGRRIALDVRLPIQRKGEHPREAGFRLLMERDGENQRGEGYFVRQGITVENPRARRPRGVRWIVDISDANLSAFLGDAENPAHTEWQRSSPKFKEKYVLGPSTIDFVRSVPSNIASILSRPAEGRDEHLLRDFFSLSQDSAMASPSRPHPSPKGPDETTVDDSFPSTIGTNGTLVLRRVKSGFRLRGTVDEDGPHRLEVSAAYDVLRGNPFRRYSAYDFQMDQSIDVKAKGARIVQLEDNRIEIQVEEPEFEVLATRFDEHRDLRVRVKPLRNGR